MTVSYAAQVLSQTMGNVLEQFGTSDAKETAKYCKMLDRFFDCLDVRNINECELKRKESLKPYTSCDDSRLEWLINDFIKYLDDWHTEVKETPGNLSKSERAKKFISWQTYKGLQINCHSMVGLVSFLLKEGMPYVLSERFCQDPLENYFGNQRSMGRRSDNPDIQQFGYNDNTVRIQRHVSHSSGNTRGRYDRKRPREVVTETKLNKRNPKQK